MLEKAQARAASIKSIDGALDLGGGLTLAAFNTAITNTNTSTALGDYNQALAAADDKSNAFVTAETTLKDMSERMLAGVGARFGKNSSQYEQAGGVRKSERKSPTRKTKPPAP